MTGYLKWAGLALLIWLVCDVLVILAIWAWAERVRVRAARRRRRRRGFVGNVRAGDFPRGSSR